LNSTQAAAGSSDSKARAPVDTGNTGGEEMLRLVQRLFLSTNKADEPRQVVFCGIGKENGSSSVCTNAGKTLAAQSSRSVCVVDANLRSSHPLNASRNKPATVREQCLNVSENFWFAGPELLTDEGGGLASASVLRETFAELRRLFEFVLIDAPGADVSGYAAILGQVSQGTVLVIDAESTRRITARKAKESLEAARVRLLGTVLNGRSFPIPKKLYNWL
jgi:receptor protein-tyrosine kinase